MSQARCEERRLSYTECHDQSLVGDQALSFRLIGAAMYLHMGRRGESAGPAAGHPVVERGVALHKLSRLLSYALSAHAYLSFVGNEFGHPEWVEMPSHHNGGSFARARRR